MSDLISRQSAIDALHMDTSIIPFEKAREYADATISEIRNRLEKLPSAQPEIIRCKDCDWWTKQEDSLQGRCALFRIYPTGGWFCGNARRREATA